ADVNAKNNIGMTVLTYATLGGHKDIVELLKKAGAKK
ncbi:MAG: ankyrin repeat domain-containing protein, partial [Candidatus Omnitrophota bacterium]